LRKRGIKVQQQIPIKVYYDETVVGEYFADILVEENIILELKAAEATLEAHIAQLVNYLKATQTEVGFVFNFGPEPKFERRVFTNKRKNPRISAYSRNPRSI